MMAGQPKPRGYLQDLQNLYKNISSSTDGQAEIKLVSDRSLIVHITPKSGCNAHATFVYTVFIFDNFDTFLVSCAFELSERASWSWNIHTNIPPEYKLSIGWCVFEHFELLEQVSIRQSLFHYLFFSCYSLLDLVKALIFLIENPNFDSPNNSFGTLPDVSQFEEVSRQLLSGQRVKGHAFSPNEAWSLWQTGNRCLSAESAGNSNLETSGVQADLASPNIDVGFWFVQILVQVLFHAIFCNQFVLRLFSYITFQ